MKAVGYTQAGPIENLQDIEVEKPSLGELDLCIAVQAISVNPVDYKIRQNVNSESAQWKILGWDAAGIITQVGSKVKNFKVGDEVWYAGDLTKNGTNAELHVVDSRIVSLKPNNLNFIEAAALPLTTITAWEMLFDRLQVQTATAQDSILIIGAAGGVGSIAIQLLKALTPLTIIGTASTPESQKWVQQLGADHVINHHLPLAEQFSQHNITAPKYVFSTNHSDDYLAQISEIIVPQGKFGLIDDPAHLNILPFKRKSISVHWEFMFTRSMFTTDDIAQQGHLLNEVKKLVEAGKLNTTLTQSFSPINAENIKKAHELLEDGHLKGKIVIHGF